MVSWATRCRLLVDSVAICSCAGRHFASFPVSAGEDDERLTVEISQQRRLMGRCGRREKFLDPATEMAGGGGVGARFVP